MESEQYSKKWIWFIIFLGIILRLRQYFGDRSLWLDESALALNIINSSYAQLLKPLAFNQAAPIGFLLLEKWITLNFGIKEYALRFIPFISGIASIFLFYKAAKLFLEQEASILALFFFSICNPAIFYSSDIKPYSLDLALSLFIIILLRKYIDTMKISFFEALSLGLASAVIIWFSYPSIFLLAGAGTTLILYSYKEKNWEKLKRLLIPLFLVGTSFLLFYWFSLKSSSQNPELLHYWKAGFPPVSFNSSDFFWYLNRFFQTFYYPVGLIFTGLASFFFLVGLISIFYSNRKNFFFLFLPLVFTLIASLMHKYPINGRLLLFAVPIFLFFTSDGILFLKTNLKAYPNLVFYLSIFILLINPFFKTIYYLKYPMTKEEIRPVLFWIAMHQKPDDFLYVYQASTLPYQYYCEAYHLHFRNAVLKTSLREFIEKFAEKHKNIGRTERIFFLFSHINPNQKEFYINLLNSVGNKVKSYRAPGASAYLYDFKMNQQKS